MRPSCTVCKRAPAVYHHRASGDRLCPRCLEKRLVRLVRRAFGRHRLVAELRPSIAFVVHPHLVLESLAGLLVFAKAEKGYASSIHVLVPEGLCGIELPEAPLRLEQGCYKPPHGAASGGLCGRERVLRASAARSTSADYIALPYPREYNLAIAFSGLAEAVPWCFYDALPRLEAKDKVFIKPFYEVLWEDLKAYAVVKGLADTYAELCAAKAVGDEVFLALVERVLAGGGAELAYSYNTVAAALYEERPTGLSPCRLCGGLEHNALLRRTGGACRYCKAVLEGEAEA